MIISEVKNLLKDSKSPVARVFFQGEKCKVLLIGFNKGMQLKDHKTPYNSKLFILEGNAVYKENDIEVELKQYSEYLIPVAVVHSVTALSDCMCMLFQAE